MPSDDGRQEAHDLAQSMVNSWFQEQEDYMRSMFQ